MQAAGGMRVSQIQESGILNSPSADVPGIAYSLPSERSSV